MREIKFRAWQKYHKKMLDVKSVDWNEDRIVSIVIQNSPGAIPRVIKYTDEYQSDFWLTDDSGTVIELMQQTGVKDKNGVEIYEGDVVKHSPDNLICYTRKVQYDGHGFTLSKLADFLQHEVDWGALEVIGNIYENPELLEK